MFRGPENHCWYSNCLRILLFLCSLQLIETYLPLCLYTNHSSPRTKTDCVEHRRGALSGNKTLQCDMGLIGLHVHWVSNVLVSPESKRELSKFLSFPFFVCQQVALQHTYSKCVRAPLTWLLQTYVAPKLSWLRRFGSRVILQKLRGHPVFWGPPGLKASGSTCPVNLQYVLGTDDQKNEERELSTSICPLR